MIGKLTGLLSDKNPPEVIVDCHGVGYEVNVPMSTFYNLPATGEKISLLTHFVVREDAQILYGFATAGEREAFRQLIRISGVGPRTEPKPDRAEGLRRARGASTLMLALPGSAYLYQGEELGLPEAIDIPDADRQDPTFWRTQGKAYGRDGCRVPIPWEADKPSYGFGPNDQTWLPQPPEYRDYSRDVQEGVDGSTLELYRTLLRLRCQFGLGTGSLEWLPGFPVEVLAFVNNGIRVYFNMSDAPVTLPEGEVLVASADVSSGSLPAAGAAWIR